MCLAEVLPCSILKAFLGFLTFSIKYFDTPLSASLLSRLVKMKADQTLSTIFRQLRPSFGKAYAQPSPLRFFSKLAASDHPILFRAQRITTHSRRVVPQNRYPFRALQVRQKSDTAATSPTSVPTAPSSQTGTPPERHPAYELTFTCKPCRHRSTHRVSKQGYHKGAVLIKCPECKNWHIICDHLKIFVDKSLTLEQLMQEKGELVKRGSLEGDVEFWDDGTTVERGEAEQRLLNLSKGKGD